MTKLATSLKTSLVFSMTILISLFVASCTEREVKKWQRGEPFPGRGNFTVSAIFEGKAFVFFGDYHDNEWNKYFWIYDPIGNKWETRDSFIGNRRYKSSSFVLGDYIYIVGGLVRRLGPLGVYEDVFSNEVFQYNPRKDSWEQLPDFPGEFREGSVALAVNGKAYYGLGDKVHALRDFWVFDESGTWTRLPDFPGKLPDEYFTTTEDPAMRSRLPSFVFGKEIVIVAGESGIDFEMWSFDTEEQHWSRIENVVLADDHTMYVSKARTSAASIKFQGKGYLIGGYGVNSLARSESILAYDHETFSWRAVDEMLGPAYVCQFAFATQDEIIFGMQNYFRASSTSNNIYFTWRYNPVGE